MQADGQFPDFIQKYGPVRTAACKHPIMRLQRPREGALLDASAFAVLFVMLKHRSWPRRLAVAAGGILGGAGLAMLDPHFGSSGLCGLSAGAHGLLAVVLCERMKRRRSVRLELIAAGVLLLKSTWEACNGTAAFMPFHIGNVGLPNAMCHLGGVMGALSTLLLKRPGRYRQTSFQS